MNEGPIAVGDVIALDGTGSSDPSAQPQPLDFLWEFVDKPAGSVSTWTATDLPHAAFLGDVSGTFEVQLTVFRGHRASEPATLAVEVQDCGAATPTVTEIVADPASPNTGDVIALSASTLDGDNSELCDLGQVLSYAWTLSRAPAASHASLLRAETAWPSLQADVPGAYEVTLVVTDDTGRSSPPSILPIDVSICGDATPVIDDVVVAPDSPRVGAAVDLVVSASDADNLEACGLAQPLGLTSEWLARPAGSSATLTPAQGPTPGFIPDVPGTYVVRTTVDDGTSRASSRDTTIEVRDCGGRPPVIDVLAWAPSAPVTGDRLAADIVVSDPDITDGCADDDTLTVSTRVLSAPPGSQSALSPADGLTPSIVADVPGAWLLRTTVTDATGRSTSQTSRVDVSTCGSAAPIVTDVATSPSAPHVGDAVALDVTVDDADRGDGCGLEQVLDVQTEIVAAPPGSAAQLAPAAGATPGFVADVPGTWVLRVTVTDDTGRTGSRDVVVEVGACGSASPEFSSVAWSPEAPLTGDAISGLVVVSDADVACGVPGTPSVQSRLASAPAGSMAMMAPSDGLTPAFVADVPGRYAIRTTAVDEQGHASIVESFVDVSECGSSAPVIDGVVWSSVAPNVGSWVSAQVSTHDPDAACGVPEALTVRSRLLAAPAGSSSALAPSDGPTPALYVDQPGTYEIETTVIDASGRAASTRTTVVAAACGSASPTVDAVVWSPAAPGVGEPVQGQVSVSDADNDAACGLGQTLLVTHALVGQPSGSRATLSPDRGLTPGLVADVPGVYTLRTTVDDGTGRTGTTLSTVTVGACGTASPSFDTAAWSPASPGVGEPILGQFSASDADNGAACGQGQTLLVTHTLVDQPAGSRVTLSPDRGLTPGWVADVAGDYTILSVVDDGTGRTGTTLSTVTVGACGSANPVMGAVTWSPASPGVHELISTQLTATDADLGAGCGASQTLTFHTEIVGSPAGSVAAMAPADGASPSFVPDRSGTYTLRSEVSDGTGRSSVQWSVVEVGVCGGQAPVALAGFLTPAAASASFVDGGIATVGDVVQLTSQDSYDPDALAPCSGDGALSVLWTFDVLPAGSFAAFNMDTLETPSFSPDVPGTYEGTLTVTDGWSTSIATFSIVATPEVFVQVGSGFEVAFVAGGTGLWSQPKGVTLDAAGLVYVVQSGDDRVTVTDPDTGATSIFALGGTLASRRGLEDVVYAPSVNAWFVSVSDRVVRIDASANQTSFFTVGSPRSLSVYTPRGQATPRLLVSSRSSGRIEQANLSTGASLGSTAQSFNIDELYGHDAAVIGATDVYFLGDPNNGELRRWTSVSDFGLSRNLETPRDVVRGPAGSVYVADSSGGVVYRVTDCGASDCSMQVVASGDWAPWGLWLEDSTTMWVTDYQGDALYRITAPAGF